MRPRTFVDIVRVLEHGARLVEKVEMLRLAPKSIRMGILRLEERASERSSVGDSWRIGRS